MAKDSKAEKQDATPDPVPDAQQPQQVQPPTLDESGATSSYSNYARVTQTPEELILDFCLNTSPQPGSVDDLKVKNRVIMSFYTAKRLLGALHMAVQRYEGAFGVLELNVAKRAGQAGGPAAPPPPGQQTN